MQTSAAWASLGELTGRERYVVVSELYRRRLALVLLCPILPFLLVAAATEAKIFRRHRMGVSWFRWMGGYVRVVDRCFGVGRATRDGVVHRSGCEHWASVRSADGRAVTVVMARSLGFVDCGAAGS